MIRFTIRELIWLTATVALAVGWACDHWAQVAVQDEFFRRYVTAVQPLGFEVERDSDGQFTITVPPDSMK